MTTLIESIQALLAPLSTGGSWYAINTTESNPPPTEYITFLRIVSVPNVNFQGPSNLQSTRVQIDIYATQISRAAALQLAVQAALQASALTNVPLSSNDTYEFEVRMFRVTLDYSFWSTN